MKKQKLWLQPFLCGAAVSLALSAIAVAVFARQFHDVMVRGATPQTGNPGTEIHCGAWGQIEALRIPLVNPGGVPPDAAERLGPPQWFFKGFNAQQLTGLFSTCGLTDAECTTLLDQKVCVAVTNGFVISPPPSLIRALRNQARGAIYTALARSPENFPQFHPFHFPSNGFERCLSAGGLSRQAINVLKSLTYADREGLCFADLQVAKELLPARDFQRFVEMLYELPAYRLRLRVGSDSNIDALVNYWGVNGRTNLLRPMITSFARVPGGTSIAVSSLLPPFARLRLYTFPTAWRDEAARRQDCFFAAMNFFNDEPDTNFLDFSYTSNVLATQYSPAGTNSLFGDVVLLLDAGGNAMHAAVYIADDFVFTKNGISPSQPWALMKMNEMLLMYYGNNAPGHTLILRRNDLQPPQRKEDVAFIRPSP